MSTKNGTWASFCGDGGLFVWQAKHNARRYKPLPWSFLLIVKILLCVLMVGISVCLEVFYIVHHSSSYPADYIYPIMLILVFGISALLHLFRKSTGLVTSGIQHNTALVFLICGLSEFYQWIRTGHENSTTLHSFPSIAYFVYYSCLIVYCFILCFADPRRKNDKSLVGPYK
ncbi:hypothetical protein WR25_03297 [Diploscapter pachys]|uniref:MARVEL domain-containing protein n=1 Tax=Diploscapter pachys TaxID=2018661 RepID=A0A2A2JQV9_9BILA|nr:hypothetical protein WR25_03297 [Diploscapter pachys]